MLKLVLATRNKNKVDEFRELLADLPIELCSALDFSETDDVEETGTTFAENALLKAKAVAEATGITALADDSGIVVDALNGEPGIYSARYGQEGWNAIQRYQYLLKNMEGIPQEQRTARFVAALVLYNPLKKVAQTVEGITEGIVTTAPAGDNGFGYDPVFFVPEYGKTMAELPDEIKNKISHRARAIAALKPILQNIMED